MMNNFIHLSKAEIINWYFVPEMIPLMKLSFSVVALKLFKTTDYNEVL